MFLIFISVCFGEAKEVLTRTSSSVLHRPPESCMRNWTLSSRSLTGHHRCAPGEGHPRSVLVARLSRKKNAYTFCTCYSTWTTPTSWRTASLWRKGYQVRRPRHIPPSPAELAAALQDIKRKGVCPLLLRVRSPRITQGGRDTGGPGRCHGSQDKAQVCGVRDGIMQMQRCVRSRLSSMPSS